MNTLGKLFAYLRVIRVYKDGDTYGFVWRWWNPVAWLFAPLTFMAMSFFEGVPYTFKNRYEVGFGINPYFIDNPNEMKWL
jgi:hypothetical protein